MPSFHEKLAEKHFVSLPISLSHTELADAMGAFLIFLENVPDDIKRTIHFKSRFERGSADGYNDKRGIEGKDSKEFFHWSPQLLVHPAYHTLNETSTYAHDFFECASRIYAQGEAVAKKLYADQFPDLVPHCFVEGRLPNAVLRFLCYSPQKNDAFSAQPHYDKGYGTLALAESTPGLRIGCCDKHPLTEVVHSEGTALFMPADLMFEDSKQTIIPAWHDVVTDSRVHPISARCGRWALVFFIGDKVGRFSSWEKVHSPLNVHG